MDPQTTWTDLSKAVEDDDWNSAVELAEALVGWLQRGGFFPNVTGQEKFDRIVVWQTIQAVNSWEVV